MTWRGKRNKEHLGVSSWGFSVDGQIKVPLPTRGMHRAGVFEIEMSEGCPRGDSHLEGRSVAHCGVPPSPSCLSIMSKQQVAAAVTSVSEISQGVCRVKRRQRLDMLGAATEGQMEEEEH